MNVQREGRGTRERMPAGLVHGKRRLLVGFSLRREQSKPRFARSRWCGFAASCRGVAVQYGSCQSGHSGSRLSDETLDERGGARVLERAPVASEAWRAKRCGRAVNGGRGGPT